MSHTAKRLGDAYFRTPRTTITAFLGLLAVLEQHPGTDWRELVGAVRVEADTGAANEQAVEADELSSFKLGAKASNLERLDERIQRWVWQKGWTGLRDAQEAAIPILLQADQDVIIAAATASVKPKPHFCPFSPNF